MEVALNAKVWFMWTVEIPLPFLSFTPYRWITAIATCALQVGIFAGGCFGFFNILTAVLSLCFLISLDSNEAYGVVEFMCFAIHSTVGLICLCFLNSGTTFMWSHFPKTILDYRSKPGPWLRRFVQGVQFFNERRIVHGYGVFPRNSLNFVRQTPYIEGTWDGGKTWQRYGINI